MGMRTIWIVGVLLVLTFVFAQNFAFASTIYTNDVGGTCGSSGVTLLELSDATDTKSRFEETFFENSTNTMHVVWFDDTTPDDIVFYSSTTDGITKTTPIVIYTGGGGTFPQVVRAEVFASGNDVFVSWLLNEDGSLFSLFEVYSADGGSFFSYLSVCRGSSRGKS